jgi:hypothetical protein
MSHNKFKVGTKFNVTYDRYYSINFNILRDDNNPTSWSCTAPLVSGYNKARGTLSFR